MHFQSVTNSKTVHKPQLKQQKDQICAAGREHLFSCNSPDQVTDRGLTKLCFINSWVLVAIVKKVQMSADSHTV